MNYLVMLHVLAVVIWVGGMLFAHMQLRPIAASQLEPPVRLKLWVGVFGRFFPWVWGSIITVLVTGFWIIHIYGGFKGLGMHINVMMTTGIIMMLIFFHVFFAPYKRLKLAVAAEDWPAAGAKLAQIRTLVGINMMIGVLTIAIRYVL
ncbi:MAG: CopD family protein [Pseudomonadota bacterium]|nr:CopD family protein [Pseudomonadota bacterium]